jgi:hypothetical protein
MLDDTMYIEFLVQFVVLYYIEFLAQLIVLNLVVQLMLDDTIILLICFGQFGFTLLWSLKRPKIFTHSFSRFRYIQSTCATSGEGLYEGLDWLSNNIATKVCSGALLFDAYHWCPK